MLHVWFMDCFDPAHSCFLVCQYCLLQVTGNLDAQNIEDLG
jgi:hypothetical protein